MGALKAAYASGSPTPPPTSPVASPEASSKPETGGSQPQSASAPPSSGSTEGRSLAEIRQRLASRNGGVNPPEAAVSDSALDRTTKETPDGGAEPLPNHPDVLKATAPSAAAPPAASPDSASPALTRGQKAAATRAANKAKAAEAPVPAAPDPGASPATVASDAPSPTETSSLPASKADQLLAVFTRIAVALEKIADGKPQ